MKSRKLWNCFLAWWVTQSKDFSIKTFYISVFIFSGECKHSDSLMLRPTLASRRINTSVTVKYVTSFPAWKQLNKWRWMQISLKEKPIRSNLIFLFLLSSFKLRSLQQKVCCYCLFLVVILIWLFFRMLNHWSVEKTHFHRILSLDPIQCAPHACKKNKNIHLLTPI